MKIRDILICVGIVMFLVFVDQITKYYAFKLLPYGKDTLCIPSLFRFHPYKNDGAIFGIFSGHFVLFYIITFVGMGVYIYLLRHGNFQKYPFYTFGLLLMMAGAIGNFIDRVSFQYVRDFITFDFFEFAIFNFADMCMTCGVIMLAIDMLFSDVGSTWK